MTSIKKRAVSGLKWVAISMYAQKFLSVLTFIILARLLEPRAFGLFAMAFIVIDALNFFKNLGVDGALVQRKDNIYEASQTAFWMLPFNGLLIFIILYAFSPAASAALNEESLIPILRTLGFIYLIGSLQVVPQALLTRQMKFKLLETRTIIASILYSAAAVVFAYLGFGVWSLVYAYLIRRIALLALTWRASGFRPKFIFKKEIAYQLIHFGKFIFGSSLIIFFISNIDNFFIGRMMGAELLGYYALAYNIASMTSTHMSSFVGRVLSPSYCQLQDDFEAIRRVNLKIFKIMALFAFYFGIIVLSYSDQIINVVYGAKWLPIVPVLKILVICSVFIPISAIFSPVFFACGKPKWNFLLECATIGLMVITIPIMIKRFGLVGAAIAVAFSKTAVIPVIFILARKLIKLTFIDMLIAVKPVVFGCIILISAILFEKLLLSQLLPLGFGHILSLAFKLIAVSGIYFATLFMIDNKGIREIIETLINRPNSIKHSNL